MKRYRSGALDLIAASFVGLGLLLAATGVPAVVLSDDAGPGIVMVVMGGLIAFVAGFLRSRSGVEIDEAAGVFLLHDVDGEPERIPIETAIARIPEPRIVLWSLVGAPAVEIRAANGFFHPCPFMHQGQFVFSPRLRRFEAECERLGVPVVRR